MSTLDKQTLKELEIFDASDGNTCLLDKLDFTVTRGGRLKLKEKLSQYHDTLDAIQEVQEGLKFILTDIHKWELHLHQEEIYHLENYFNSSVAPVFSANKLETLIQIVRYQVLYKGEYRYIRAETHRFLFFLLDINKIVAQLNTEDLPLLLKSWVEKVQAIMSVPEISKALSKTLNNRLDFIAVIEYDRLFRVKLKDNVQSLFDALFEMDALISMAKSIRQYNLVFPQLTESDQPFLEIVDLYHPFLSHAVTNNISFTSRKNFIFLTGPNTAGKTTLMKACGLAVYLAHIGMGVPAGETKMSVFSAIFSSMSPTDNLNAGYSYFYSEVRRIKEAVVKLKENNRMFIMFDELFRGTNVKDAYDCSVLVIAGLQQYASSLFILSSHLTELANSMENYTTVSYRSMESSVENGKPVFSYKLKEGVSKERLGLVILENERIFD